MARIAKGMTGLGVIAEVVRRQDSTALTFESEQIHLSSSSMDRRCSTATFETLVILLCCRNDGELFFAVGMPQVLFENYLLISKQARKYLNVVCAYEGGNAI
jgi:hypothetical protein